MKPEQLADLSLHAPGREQRRSSAGERMNDCDETMWTCEAGGYRMNMRVAAISTILLLALCTAGCGKNTGQAQYGLRDFSAVVPHDTTYLVATRGCSATVILGDMVEFPEVLAYRSEISQRMVAVSDKMNLPDSTATMVSFFKSPCDRSYIEAIDRELARTQMTPEKEFYVYLGLNPYRKDFIDIEIDRIRNERWYGIVITRFIAHPKNRTDLVVITAYLYDKNTDAAREIDMRIINETITVEQAKSIIASIINGRNQ